MTVSIAQLYAMSAKTPDSGTSDRLLPISPISRERVESRFGDLFPFIYTYLFKCFVALRMGCSSAFLGHRVPVDALLTIPCCFLRDWSKELLAIPSLQFHPSPSKRKYFLALLLIWICSTLNVANVGIVNIARNTPK